MSPMLADCVSKRFLFIQTVFYSCAPCSFWEINFDVGTVEAWKLDTVQKHLEPFCFFFFFFLLHPVFRLVKDLGTSGGMFRMRRKCVFEGLLLCEREDVCNYVEITEKSSNKMNVHWYVHIWDWSTDN